jgi:hypothetical protein
MEITPELANSLAPRLWRRVVKSDGCWNWTGNKLRGCGTFSFGRATTASGHATVRVPRVAWVIHFGPIPAGMCVCHHCDNPSCVRPEHLFLGTQKDNMADRDRKGRANWQQQGFRLFGGQRNLHRSRLTDEQIREIRARYSPRGAGSGSANRRLASDFGISLPYLWLVATGQAPRHSAAPSEPERARQHISCL